MVLGGFNFSRTPHYGGDFILSGFIGFFFLWENYSDICAGHTLKEDKK